MMDAHARIDNLEKVVIRLAMRIADLEDGSKTDDSDKLASADIRGGEEDGDIEQASPPNGTGETQE